MATKDFSQAEFLSSKGNSAPSWLHNTCLYFDSVQFGGKLVVDCKHMAAFDLFALGLFRENSLGGFPTGQRLQCPHQLPFWDVRLLLDLLKITSQPE